MESTIVPSQSNKYGPNDPSGNFSFIGFFVSLPTIFASHANLKLILLSRLPCRGKLFHQFLFAFQQFAQPSTARVGFDRFLYLRQLLLDLAAAQGIQAAFRFFPSRLLPVFKQNVKKYAPIPLVQL